MKYVFVFAVMLLSSMTFAQKTVVTGRVIDSENGQPLPGATVQIKGTTTGVVTDVNGEFSLRLTTDQDALQIKYLGYQESTVDVDISSGKYLEISLSEVNIELQAVTIRGSLEGEMKALNQQKNAPNILNVVSADQISRFPDPNVAEAIQRVPGTTLQRDQGEGRYVIIRGLAPQFTNININGEQIPSPEAGVRFVALDAIPADQLSSIEVSKTLTPDMDGDAVGGSVNLITRKAKSDKLELQATAVGGYNQLMGEPNGQGSLLIGKRFGADQKLGILVNGSYYFTDRGSDNWERDGSEIELRDYELRRTRGAISGTIDYRFNPNNELYFRAIYNDFSDREWRRRYVFKPNEDNSPFEDNEIERLTKDRFERQVISSFNFGGIHRLSKVNIDYEFAYSKAYQDTPFDYETNFIAEPDALTTDFSDPDWPTFSTNDDFNYLDNTNYEFDEYEAGSTYTEDENITGKINISIPYDIAGDENGLIKFGSKYRAKTKDLSVVSDVFEWAGDEISFEGQEGDFTLEKFEGGLLDDNFLDGRYELAPAADMERFVRFFNDNRNGFELNTEDKLANESVESYKASEDVFAAYAMTQINLNKLEIVAGLRYEQTNVEYDFNTVVFDDEGNLDEIVPESGETDYSFLLPQISLRYALTDLTNLRFAATRSYARPNFESIVPSQEINFQDLEGVVGNPNLAPVDAFNLDLMADHYFENIGVVSVGVFYKRLDNFIYTRVFDATEYNGNDFGTEIELRQAVNGDNGSITGFEIAYQQNLTFLPGFLKGFGVYANYTFASSSATLDDRSGVGESEEIDLPGQASHVGNLSLSYTTGGLNLRVSGNFAGAYLDELDEDAGSDVYINKRTQWDVTANYQINNRFNVFTEFLNISNAPFETYIGGDQDQFIQREFYSWWMRLGVKFNL